MMKHSLVLLLFPLGVGVCVSPALAEDPYYFHKADVSREKYMDDVNDCAELSGSVRAPHYQVYAYGPDVAQNAIVAGVGSFFAAMAEGRERRRLISRVERTCMADKGYERRSLDKTAYGTIRKLVDDKKIDHMFALVASKQPVGKVLVE